MKNQTSQYSGYLIFTVPAKNKNLFIDFLTYSKGLPRQAALIDSSLFHNLIDHMPIKGLLPIFHLPLLSY